jgi:hypothetical protein
MPVSTAASLGPNLSSGLNARLQNPHKAGHQERGKDSRLRLLLHPLRLCQPAAGQCPGWMEDLIRKEAEH